MKSLQSALEDYVKLIEQQEGANLGGEAKREVTTADNERFARLLDEQLKFNRAIIVIAITLLCILFGVGMFLVYTLRTSPTGIVTISGGSFLSFLLIIRWLRRLWIEKSIIDVLLYAARDMPPKEAARFLTGFYFKMIRRDAYITKQSSVNSMTQTIKS